MRVSYWSHRKPVQRTRAVDVDEVARSAVSLLDGGGLRALTVRAVAHDLGVAAASLYSRIESVDDLFDLALDRALGDDSDIRDAIDGASLPDLMLAHYRHLVRHRWACQVLGMRAPRGPHHLALSERMVVLLVDAGAADPLGSAYALSNFVIGSATAAPMVDDERAAPIDAGAAPVYARLHAEHRTDPESILIAGLEALHSRVLLHAGDPPTNRAENHQA